MRVRHCLLAGVFFLLGLFLSPLVPQYADGQAQPPPAPGKVGKYQVAMCTLAPGGFYAILCDTETGQLWLYPNREWKSMDSPVQKKK